MRFCLGNREARLTYMNINCAVATVLSARERNEYDKEIKHDRDSRGYGGWLWGTKDVDAVYKILVACFHG